METRYVRAKNAKVGDRVWLNGYQHKVVAVTQTTPHGVTICAERLAGGYSQHPMLNDSYLELVD